MYYGLDVHKKFVQVCCLSKDGSARKDFQILTTPESLAKFAGSLTDG